MKSYTLFIPLIFLTFFLNSCATIVGGSRYYAQVIVEGRPNAKIIYDGVEKGKGGRAQLTIKRKKANKLTFIVKEQGYQEQQYTFRRRSFRGWALMGTILVFNVNGLPVGVGVDFLTGALWKPCVEEKGVEKADFKHFRYVLRDKPQQIEIRKQEIKVADNKEVPVSSPGVDFVYLKDGRIIKGTILEEVVGVSVRIRTEDGIIRTFSADEVEKTSMD